MKDGCCDKPVKLDFKYKVIQKAEKTEVKTPAPVTAGMQRTGLVTLSTMENIEEVKVMFQERNSCRKFWAFYNKFKRFGLYTEGVF